MPPISGMQAIAAATFEGRPVVPECGPGSGGGLGGGATGSWSGMTYIHKTADVLSSNPCGAMLLFSLPLWGKANIVALEFNTLHDQQSFPRVYPDRNARRPGGHRHHDVHDLSRLHNHFAARQSDKGHEQPASDRACDTDVHE